MVEFFNKYINPASTERAKVSVWMVAQATSDVSTKQISELVKSLDLKSTEREAETATDLQARLSAAGHDETKEIEGLRDYLLHELKVSETKIDASVESWKKLHTAKTNGVVGRQDENPPSLNGTEICFVDNIRDFKARLPVSAGARPVRDLTEYEELEPKL